MGKPGGRTPTSQVFRRISKQLPQLTTLEFQYVSPKLLMARNLDLAVPGPSPRSCEHRTRAGRVHC